MKIAKFFPILMLASLPALMGADSCWGEAGPAGPSPSASHGGID